MQRYSKRLEQHIRQRAQQALLQQAATPVIARARQADGSEVWAVRSKRALHGQANDPQRQYWPIDQHVRIEGSRNGRAMIVAFGLDYGPLGLGRLYAVDLSDSEAPSRSAETMAEFPPNPHGLLQVPAALGQDAQGCFYVVMAYLAVRGMPVAQDAPAGALWRVALGQDAEPVLLHAFQQNEGQPACLAPAQTAPATGFEPAWVRETPDGRLKGSLQIGALRGLPPGSPSGQTVHYEIHKDGSGFRLLPADSHATAHADAPETADELTVAQA